MASKDEGPRDFSATLRHVEHGDFLVELAEKQQKLVLDLAEAADQRGQATGEITIKLKYKMAKNGVVDLTGDVGVRAPKPVRGVTIAWATPGGNLLPSDPKQTTLPLREVQGGAGGEVRDAAPAAGAVRGA